MHAASRSLSVLLLLAFGCGGAQVSANAKQEPDTHTEETLPAPEASPNQLAKQKAQGPEPEAPEAPVLEELPRYTPELVQEAIDRTAAPADDRARLGLRLAALDQGPDAPWIVAIVNRGVDRVKVLPDLRMLTLTVMPPAPDPSNKRSVRVKLPKPVKCALPRELVPSSDDDREKLELEPGEGLIDRFDPRLYCMPLDGKSPLVPGATVEVRLGWAEKVKAVYRKGRTEKVPLDQQVPPFIAERAMPAEDLSAMPAEATRKISKEAPPTEAHAVKELVAPSVELGAAYAQRIELEEEEPFALVLTRGSDARTEREATLTVALTNRSKKAQRVLFRREFLTFEVSGPAGLVACEPVPDQRAPDRIVISTLAPGRQLSAKSRLIELCPEGALRTPGLYLIHARFDPVRTAEPGGPSSFLGRVVSKKPALVRVRKGWGALVQREPERIRVGSLHAE